MRITFTFNLPSIYIRFNCEIITKNNTINSYNVIIVIIVITVIIFIIVINANLGFLLVSEPLI